MMSFNDSSADSFFQFPRGLACRGRYLELSQDVLDFQFPRGLAIFWAWVWAFWTAISFNSLED